MDALGDTFDEQISNSVMYEALQVTPPDEGYDLETLNICNTFGTDMLLTAFDNHSGSNRAEDNADNWARFAQIYLAIVAYPEYYFLSGQTIKRQHTLLHHCSLLNPLRLECVGPICDLDGYNASKDLFKVAEAGYEPPASSREVLELTLIMANHYKRARSLKDILRELDVRTGDDPAKEKGGEGGIQAAQSSKWRTTHQKATEI